jgi:Protein of unknown function (DUF3105)
VSKANRRRQRPGNQPSTNRPTGSPPTGPSTSSATTGGAASAGAGIPPAGGTSTGAGGTTGTTSTATPRPTGTGPRPTSTAARHGRRERQRTTYKPSFMERYRTAIIVVAALAGVALISVFVFMSASQSAYACSTIWTPEPTASPSAGATENLGYVQPDMGNSHVGRGVKVTYTYCAPASGSHVNLPGVAGPIAARVYGPTDNVVPEGWIHNLEHGGLVILYKSNSEGGTPEGQAKFKAFYEAFPPAQNCGPIIAPFDQMSSPFQAILWGRVLPLETFDEARVTAFWEQWGGRTNPEKGGCPTPNQSSAPIVSGAPSTQPATSAAPSAAPTAAPTAAPSAAAPSPS